MSASYSSSPYFRVDQDAIHPSFDSETSTSEMDQSEASVAPNHNTLFSKQREYDTKEEEEEPQNSVAETPTVATETSTTHQHSEIRAQTLGRCCRGLLKEIQDLTYLSSDELALESLKQSLHQALNSFHAQVASENGTFMEVAQPRKKIKLNSRQTQSSAVPQRAPKKYA